MSTLRAGVSALALLLIADLAFAQTPLEPYVPPKSPAAPDPMALLLRLIGLLALTLVICGGLILWARRLNRVSGADAAGSERLKIQSSVAVDARCAVHLVEVDGQTVAVTTDATGVRSMALLSEPIGAWDEPEVPTPEIAEAAG